MRPGFEVVGRCGDSTAAVTVQHRIFSVAPSRRGEGRSTSKPSLRRAGKVGLTCQAQTGEPRAEASAPCTRPPGSAPLSGIGGGGDWNCPEGFVYTKGQDSCPDSFGNSQRGRPASRTPAFQQGNSHHAGAVTCRVCDSSRAPAGCTAGAPRRAGRRYGDWESAVPRGPRGGTRRFNQVRQLGEQVRGASRAAMQGRSLGALGQVCSPSPGPRPAGWRAREGGLLGWNSGPRVPPRPPLRTGGRDEKRAGPWT